MPPGQSFSFFSLISPDVILRSVPSDEADIFSAPGQDSNLFGGGVSGGRGRVTCITPPQESRYFSIHCVNSSDTLQDGQHFAVSSDDVSHIVVITLYERLLLAQSGRWFLAVIPPIRPRQNCIQTLIFIGFSVRIRLQGFSDLCEKIKKLMLLK